MPLSFFSRLYLSIAVTVIFSVFIAVTVAELFIQQDELKQFSREAKLVANYIEQQVNEDKNLALPSKQLTLPYPFNLEFSAQLVEPKARVCHDCNYLTTIGSTEIYQRDEGERYTVLPITGSEQLLAVYEKLDSERSQEELEQFHDDVHPESIMIVTLLIILAIFLAFTIYWPVKQLQQQIHKLIASQQHFGQGHLDTRADEQIQRPINLLAQSFNQMAQDIADNVKERDIFAQAIPHEVRTPLSRIQLASGLARKRTGNEDVHLLLDDIDNYVGDINLLIAQIVEFSRIAANKTAEQSEFQTIDVAKFIDSRLSLLKQGVEIDIEYQSKTQAKLTTNPVYLRLLIDNFIKNALSHAKAKVLVSVIKNEHSLLVAVEDDGTGIPEKDRENIFIPFARLDKSRTRATGGLGLGLAIAKAASDKMAGKISVTTASIGGARFCFQCELKTQTNSTAT